MYTPYTVAEFKVGFDHLNLVNAQYGKTVSPGRSCSWTAMMNTCPSVAFSSMIPRVFDNEKVFFYRNSFSAYDTFRFLGKSELNLEYERSIGITVRKKKSIPSLMPHPSNSAQRKLKSAKQTPAG